MKSVDLSDCVTEAQWQRTVMECAAWQGWRVYHVPDSRRVTDPGFPDLVCVHPDRGEVVWLELKTNKGRVKPAQREWLAALRKAGQRAYVARPRDVEKVERLLQGEEVEL